VCTPKIKGCKTQPKFSPTPCKSQKTNTESKGHNPRVDLCPLIEQKMKKMGDFRRIGVSGGMGEKWEFWANGQPAVGGYGGEGPAVMFWWWGRWWVVVGWCERVVFWRMRDGGRVSGKREKRENGGFWVAGGEWDGRRNTGGGVSVVGEVVGGGGLHGI
jgi:hypothetical protein